MTDRPRDPTPHPLPFRCQLRMPPRRASSPLAKRNTAPLPPPASPSPSPLPPSSAKFHVYIGSEASGWKRLATTLSGMELSQPLSSAIVMPALIACDVSSNELQRIDAHLPGKLAVETIKDISQPASSFAAHDGSKRTLYVVLGPPVAEGDPSVRVLRANLDHLARRKRILLGLLAALLAMLLVGAFIAFVYLTTARTPRSFAIQAWGALRRAFSSSATLPLRQRVIEPFSPLGRASSLGPPWKREARPWLEQGA